MLNQKRNGFTIIELIIVIAIIGILASFLIPAGGRARERARMAKASSQIAAMELAITAFQNDFGLYPTNQVGGTVESNNKLIVELLTGFAFSGGSKSASTEAKVTSATWNGPYLEIDVADTDNAGAMKDPWGNAYTINLDLDGNSGTTPPSNNLYTFDIISTGPDGASGGGDDVKNF